MGDHEMEELVRNGEAGKLIIGRVGVLQPRLFFQGLLEKTSWVRGI